MTSRFTTTVGIITATTLLLQVTMLLKSQCYLQRQNYIRLNSSDKADETYLRDIQFSTSESYTRETTPRQKNYPKRWLTIGIPTIQRQNGSYLFKMLDSLFNQTRKHQIYKIYVVIFLADFDKTEWKHEMERNLTRTYFRFFETGTLKLIRAPREFYSGFNTSSEESKYWYWRTKQNYDFAFIMQYCQEMSEFYMQLEDDVITAEGYIDSINDYMRKQGDKQWLCLEFSKLGFIGKLYRSIHLKDFAQFLLIFSETQPVDFNLGYFLMIKGQGQRYTRIPTLFQHIGYHSSLPDKVQGLKDNLFSLPKKKYIPDNPEAILYTNFSVFSEFQPELAYSNETGYFWTSASAKQGDVFTIKFKAPQKIDKIIVETGAKDHLEDIIRTGVVEASVMILDEKKPPYCKNFVVIGQFVNGVANITAAQSKILPSNVRCLQIRITENQTQWVIIREIAIWTRK